MCNIAHCRKNYALFVNRGYIQRAYAAVKTDEEKEKLEEYLKQRIDPLIQSGAVFAVNWTNEPLPHEVFLSLI